MSAAQAKCGSVLPRLWLQRGTFLNTSHQALWNLDKWVCIHIGPLSCTLSDWTLSFAPVSFTPPKPWQTDALAPLIAEITNEMPYELPGLPPRNESPGQFAWEVIESPAVRERGDVLRITAQLASLWVWHEKPFSSTECQGFSLSFM